MSSRRIINVVVVSMRNIVNILVSVRKRVNVVDIAIYILKFGVPIQTDVKTSVIVANKDLRLVNV